MQTYIYTMDDSHHKLQYSPNLSPFDFSFLKEATLHVEELSFLVTDYS